MIGDYVERLHERDLETLWSNSVPEYVACSLYLSCAIEIKGTYSWVIYCKCLNEDIKVLCVLKSLHFLLSYYCNYGLP